MPPAVCNVLLPSQVGLARFVVHRLGRPEWLEVPWVHASVPLDLSRDFPEHAVPPPPSLAVEAQLISLALRLGAVDHVRELWLQASSFGFFPGRSASELERLLRRKGFSVLDVPAEALAAAAPDPTAVDAKEALLTAMTALPQAPIVGTLLLELCEERPAAMVLMARRHPARLALLSPDDPRVEAALGAAFAALSTEDAASLMRACARHGHARLAGRHAPDVAAVVGSPSPAAARPVRAKKPPAAPPFAGGATEAPPVPTASPSAPRPGAASFGNLPWFTSRDPGGALPRNVEEVIADPQVARRRSLAKEESRSTQVLVALADDADPKVRMTVARSSATPPVILAWLARDPDPEVRQQLLASSRCPEEVAALLADDDVLAVRAAAKVRLAKIAAEKEPKARKPKRAVQP